MNATTTTTTVAAVVALLEQREADAAAAWRAVGATYNATGVWDGGAAAARWTEARAALVAVQAL